MVVIRWCHLFQSAAGLAQGLTIINDWIAGKAADLSYDIFVIDIGDFVTSNVPGAVR